MKKIITATLAVLLCFPVFAQEEIEFTWTGRKYESGTVFNRMNYSVYPDCKSDAAVYVFLEPKNTETYFKLMDEGVIPKGLMISIWPGNLNPADTLASSRFMRAEEFDQNGREFSDCIVEEIVPAIASAAGVTISSDPDKHFISGCSSGGCAAWNALWYRNDFFHRGYLASPTFSSMRGAEEHTVLVRKMEPRPIRVYITGGTNEPDYFFGDSFYAQSNAASALDYAGYDFKFEMFANEGHGARRSNPQTLEKVLRWVFAEEKVSVPNRSVRFSNLIPEGSVWEEAVGVPPVRATEIKTSAGKYFVKKGKLFFKPLKGRKQKLEDISDVTAIGLSSDLWRLYATSTSRRFVYAYTLDPEGVPSAQYKLAPLTLKYDCRTAGGFDLCVSAEDRTFVATELGVQSICSFGLMDIILPLPGDVAADRVWLDGGYLFASSGDKTWRRPVNAAPHDGKTLCKPSKQRYDDGFNYSRHHFKSLIDRLKPGESITEY